nr:GPP34 family phosphoprotein [Angustibacter aerolatus]
MLRLGRWVPAAADAHPAAEPLERVRAAVTQGGDPRGGRLLALLDAARAARAVLPDLPRADVRRAGARLRATDPVAQAVRAALRRRESVG